MRHLLRSRWLYVSLAALVLITGATLYITRDETRAPSNVLDLSNWKLTLPIDSQQDGEPDEIKQPQLGTYSSAYFRLNPAGDGVTFRAVAGGIATEGAEFARSELREMANNGTERAAWDSESSTHSMTIRQSIDHLPPARPSIVAGQIHGGDEYLMLVRLDGQRLYVKADDKNQGDLDTSYQLGEVFTLTLEASNGRIRVYYNNELKVELERTCRECYFKAGAYLQTNVEWGEPPNTFGEVTIHDLQVQHN